MRSLLALMHHVAQIRAVEARDVLMRVAQLELLENVVPHAARRARGEGGDRLVRKILPQRAELPVLRAELVPPFGNAVRLVDREERERHFAAASAIVSCRASRSGER